MPSSVQEMMGHLLYILETLHPIECRHFRRAVERVYSSLSHHFLMHGPGEHEQTSDCATHTEQVLQSLNRIKFLGACLVERLSATVFNFCAVDEACGWAGNIFRHLQPCSATLLLLLEAVTTTSWLARPMRRRWMTQLQYMAMRSNKEFIALWQQVTQALQVGHGTLVHDEVSKQHSSLLSSYVSCVSNPHLHGRL
jgi:hypothetical protein